MNSPARRRVAVAVAAVALACLRNASLAAEPDRQTDSNQPAVKVKLAAGADSARLRHDQGALVVEVRSKRGIGRLSLVRNGKAWPQSVALRIDIAGLEGLTLDDGRWRLRSFLGARRVEVIKSPPGRKAGEKLPAIPIRRLGKRLIEIRLPAALLAPASKEVHVAWVDFYRG